MNIFKVIFTNVLLFRHVWVSECASREVDCILYGMFNVQKKNVKKEKKKTAKNSPLLPDSAVSFEKLSGSTWLPSAETARRSLTPSVFHHHSSVSPTKKRKHRLLNSGLRFFAILKEEIQSCDRLRNTLLWTYALSTLNSQSFDFFLFVFYEDELHLHGKKHKHVEKKCFKISTLPWVFA